MYKKWEQDRQNGIIPTYKSKYEKEKNAWVTSIKE
jgi:hypothetical protein